jgi:hypothetical protein
MPLYVRSGRGEREEVGQVGQASRRAQAAASARPDVKTHVSSLYRKLGVTRRSEALAIARSSGVL